MILYIYFSLICLLYLWKVCPFERKALNLINCFNELSVILACIISGPFIKELNSEPNLKKTMSYIFCVQYTLVIGINLATMLILAILKMLERKKRKSQSASENLRQTVVKPLAIQSTASK